MKLYSFRFNNVIISLIEPCPLFWENAATCANLTFSLPIVKSNQTTGQEWSGYQLNTEHLKAMWDTYALKHLNTVGLDIYEVPNVTKIFSGRLIVICIIIVAMVVLILIFRAVINKINKKRFVHFLPHLKPSEYFVNKFILGEDTVMLYPL